MDLLQHLAATIVERKLIARGAKILVAVSGGVDSMVLLQCLTAIARENRWKIQAAHFDHHLRGRSSAADAKFVRAAAARLGVGFVAGQGSVRTHAQQRGISIEMAARELRHQFLARSARQFGCGSIVLAHHADDQVELFFLRLLRGAGPAGLGGMAWTSESPVDPALRLVRPLLDCAKTVLRDYAKENQIRFREDASNRSLDVLRNRVRQELLPLLADKYQPAIRATVLRAMDLIGAEGAVVHESAQRYLAAPGPLRWGKLLPAQQRRVICAQLLRKKISADFELVESLRSKPGIKVMVGAKQAVQADNAGLLRSVDPQPKRPAFGIHCVKIGLATQASVQFDGSTLSWNFGRRASRTAFRGTIGQEMFDADRVGPEIVLRHWQPGDRFRPIGMPNAVKLQDCFTNLKIPAHQRRELSVAARATGEIFWVEGLRIGENFKLTEHTTRTLIWRWNRP